MKGLYLENGRDDRFYNPIKGLFGMSLDEKDIIDSVIEKVWSRIMKCVSGINDPYYNTIGINPYHSGQYLIFLYFLSNEIYNTYILNKKEVKDARVICDKIFMTNLTVSNVDLYYEHKLPDVFYPGHPLGAVLTGKASIDNYFMFTQGCNIGINKGKGPQIGKGILMWGDSKIVGDCTIGDNVVFSANSYIKDMDIPSNSIVFGQYPNVTIKENREDEVKTLLNEYLKLD